MAMPPLQIGITGGIGSGKSIVSRIFHCLGVPVYDADNHAKNLMTEDTLLISSIKMAFGTSSYYNDGSLNRAFISEQVFDNVEKLKLLNDLVHPRVKADYDKWVNDHCQYDYLIKEAALLFESNSYKMLDKIITVSAPEKLRIKRVLQRDIQRTETQIRAIISTQMSEDEKLKKSDFVIVNDEEELIIPQILKLHKQFAFN